MIANGDRSKYFRLVVAPPNRHQSHDPEILRAGMTEALSTLYPDAMVFHSLGGAIFSRGILNMFTEGNINGYMCQIYLKLSG